jgi:prophage regulatory protein
MQKIAVHGSNEPDVGDHPKDHKPRSNAPLQSDDAGPKSKPIRFLSRDDLRARGIRYSNVHLLRLEADGKFPERVYLSPSRVVWIESEIDEYVARCIKARG